MDEGYRWNLPVITYGFDASFVNYFGTRGMAEVEKAISMFNSLPKFSDIKDDGSQLLIKGKPVPTDTRMKNYEAGTLGLLDLKSFALSLMVEELGLAQPERYVWALRNAHTGTTAGQPYTNYTVIQYNYSPIYPYGVTPYVNNVYYTYDINSYTLPYVMEDAEEVAGSGLFPFSTVAGFNMNEFNEGEFFTALTQDDVGGLKYLYSKDRLCVENLLTNASFGKALSGGSPWMPYFTSTNFITQGTNATLQTNVLVVAALRPGINKLQFQRVNYDSLLGNTFIPFTNYWTDTYVSNGVLQIQPVQRVITRPDFLFVVDDLGIFTDSGWPIIAYRTDTSNWQNNDAINGNDTVNSDGGPGVIQPPVTISFSKRLPYFRNYNGYYVGTTSTRGQVNNQAAAESSMIWGSFDATTNAAVVYPAYRNITVNDLRSYTVGGGQ